MGVAVSSFATDTFRWTGNEGPVPLLHWSTEPTYDHSEVEDISADGSLIVGKSLSPDFFMPTYWNSETLEPSTYPVGDSIWLITAVSATGDTQLLHTCSFSGSDCFTYVADGIGITPFGLTEADGFNYAYPVDISSDGNLALVRSDYAGQARLSYVQ